MCECHGCTVDGSVSPSLACSNLVSADEDGIVEQLCSRYTTTSGLAMSHVSHKLGPCESRSYVYNTFSRFCREYCHYLASLGLLLNLTVRKVEFGAALYSCAFRNAWSVLLGRHCTACAPETKTTRRRHDGYTFVQWLHEKLRGPVALPPCMRGCSVGADREMTGQCCSRTAVTSTTHRAMEWYVSYDAPFS
jgi:hypothetical protein